MPRMTPFGDVGRRGVRAYTARAGQNEEAYLQQLGELLTSDLAGAALVDLVRRTRPPLLPSTHSPVPGCRQRSTIFSMSSIRSAGCRNRPDLDLRRIVHVAARHADDLVTECEPHTTWPYQDRRTIRSSPPVTPFGERDERRSEVAALVGQHVLEQHGLLRVAVPSHDPGIDEAVEAVLQDVGRDPEAALEVAVAGRTGEEGGG